MHRLRRWQPSEPGGRCRCRNQRRPQISPRRAPVVMVSQTSAPRGSGPRALDQPRRFFGGERPGSGWGSGACWHVGRVDEDPLPHHSSVEGAAGDPVDLPEGRVREPAANLRLAGSPTRGAPGLRLATRTVARHVRRSDAAGWSGAADASGGSQCSRQLARLRGFRFSSTWCSSRVRTFSASSPAFGPGGTTSVRYIRRLEIGSVPLYTRTRRAPDSNSSMAPRWHVRRLIAPQCTDHCTTRVMMMSWAMIGQS